MGYAAAFIILSLYILYIKTDGRYVDHSTGSKSDTVLNANHAIIAVLEMSPGQECNFMPIPRSTSTLPFQSPLPKSILTPGPILIQAKRTSSPSAPSYNKSKRNPNTAPSARIPPTH